jgi:hypothetical protein
VVYTCFRHSGREAVPIAYDQVEMTISFPGITAPLPLWLDLLPGPPKEMSIGLRTLLLTSCSDALIARKVAEHGAPVASSTDRIRASNGTNAGTKGRQLC